MEPPSAFQRFEDYLASKSKKLEDIIAGTIPLLERMLAGIEEFDPFDTMEIITEFQNRQKAYYNSQAPPPSFSAQASTLSLSPLRKQIANIQKTMVTKDDLKQLQPAQTYSPSTYTEQYNALKSQQAPPWFNKEKIPQLRFRSNGQSIYRNIFSSPPPPGASESMVVQPWWTNRIKKLSEDKNLPIELTDEHSHATIGTRRPDSIGWERGKPHNAFNIVLVADLKPGREETALQQFRAEEIGRLVSFMQDLIRNFHPHRVQVTGFLCDGRIIQFFLLSMKDGAWNLFETPVYFLDGEGGEYLVGLLATPAGNLGMPPPLQLQGMPIQMKKVLGLGASSVVYQAVHLDEPVVVKHFRPGQTFRLDAEQSTLESISHIQELADKTTQLIGCTDDHSSLLLKPVGLQFKASPLDTEDHKIFATSEHFIQLISILKDTHEIAHLVHRDVTLNNFFLSPSQKVFLNDWGCAVAHGKKVTFSGCLPFAPDRILTGLCTAGKEFEYQPEPRDDLEMVVKCLFGRLNSIILTLPFPHNDISTANALIEFWKQELAPQVWQDLLAAAKECSYSVLQNLVKNLLA